MLELCLVKVFEKLLHNFLKMCIFLSDYLRRLSYGGHTIRSILLDQSIGMVDNVNNTQWQLFKESKKWWPLN